VAAPPVHYSCRVEASRAAISRSIRPGASAFGGASWKPQEPEQGQLMSSKYVDETRVQRRARQEYAFDDHLDGRTVLVAGGAGGLGAAVCARLLRAGADVVIGYARNDERATNVRDGLETQYDRRVRVLRADITSDEGRDAILDDIDDESFYGAVVCVGDPARVAPEDLSVATLEEGLRINYTGPVLLARGCAELLARREVPGALVLLSSMQGVAAFPGSLAYSGPKSALVQAARILAQEYGGRRNIRVNVVAPGATESGMALTSIASGKYDPYVDDGVIPRFGYPEDVARAVWFFMAPDNYVTGQTLLVDGGLTLLRGTV
jgi:NAD(P)-dependent dehydrogenase (short-subunit alcohol dehydrogenase family)